MNHEVVDNYIKMIKKEISSIYSADEFLSSMREYLDDYCDEHPGCTTEDLEEEFGTPEEIANEFLESKNVSNSGRIKKLRNSRRLIAIIAVVLVVDSSCSGSRIDSGDCLLQGCAEPVYAGKSNGCDCNLSGRRS